MKRRHLGFANHSLNGVIIGLAIALAAVVPLAGTFGKLPGAPAGWPGWTLIGIGVVLYVVAGFATWEMMLFLGAVGLGVPWGAWALLELAGLVRPLTEASGRWAWYVLYAHALAPVLLAGALFLWLWLRGRRE